MILFVTVQRFACGDGVNVRFMAVVCCRQFIGRSVQSDPVNNEMTSEK